MFCQTKSPAHKAVILPKVFHPWKDAFVHVILADMKTDVNERWLNLVFHTARVDC